MKIKGHAANDAILQDIIKALSIDLDIALIGGHAAVLHGVERTTLDIDFCIHSHTADQIYADLVKSLPGRFEATLVKEDESAEELIE